MFAVGAFVFLLSPRLLPYSLLLYIPEVLLLEMGDNSSVVFEFVFWGYRNCESKAHCDQTKSVSVQTKNDGNTKARNSTP